MNKIKLSRDQELTTQLLQKILQLDEQNRRRYDKLERYYNAQNDILDRPSTDPSKPNNKISNPFAAYISDTLTGYMVGTPVTYSSSDEAALAELQAILTYNDEAKENMSIARDGSIYGKSNELLYVSDEGYIRMAKVSPKHLTVVYDDTIEENVLYAIRKVANYDIMTGFITYDIEVYSESTIKYYKADERFTQVTFVEEKPHAFGDVPIAEYWNNEGGIGDFEEVIPLIDSYDSLESDNMNDIDYFTDAYLILRGVTATAEDIAQMKENRVLLFDDSTADAEWLIKNTTNSNVEQMKDRIVSDIHKFSRVPDLSDEAFAGNASGVAIKYKLYGTETLVANKERYFQQGLQRRIELIFNYLGKGYDWRSIEMQFTRDMPENEQEIADIAQKLSGIVSTETLLAQIPFVADVDAELIKLEEEQAKKNDAQPFYDLGRELASGL